MAFLRKFRKIKSSDTTLADEPNVHLAHTSDTTSRNEEVESQSTSSVVSDPEPDRPEEQSREQSPEQEPVSMTGSLFSGMVLSRTARKQEDNSSPYLQKRSLGNQEESSFSFLNENGESVSDTSQLGFSFIKAKQDIPLNNNVEDTHVSSFGFMNKSPELDGTSMHTSSFSFISDISVNEETCSKTSSTMTSSQTPPLPTLRSSHQKINRQVPPSINKKKKHKAIRPGQERQDIVICFQSQDQATSGLTAVVDNNTENSATMLVVTDTECVSNKPETSSTDPSTTCITTENSSIIELNLESNNSETVLKSACLHCKESLDDVPNGTTLVDATNVLISESPCENRSNKVSRDISVGPSPSHVQDMTSAEDHIANAPNSENVDVFVAKSFHENDVGKYYSDESFTHEDGGTQSVTIHDTNEAGNIPNATELEEFQSKLKSEYDRLKNHYGSKIEKIINSLKLRISKRENIQDLKLKEEAALAEENYELAEDLRQELESIEAGEDTSIMTDGHSILIEWLDECTALVDHDISHSEKLLDHLTELENEHSKELLSFDKDFSLHHAKKKMDLQTLADKIEKEKGHIALDRQHFEKKQQILKDEVTDRAAEFIVNKKQLEEDQIQIQEEILILEEKLQKLNERKQELVVLITKENLKIEAVHKELSSNQEELDKEENSLKHSEDEVQQQLAVLEALQMDYANTKQKHDDSRRKLQVVIDDCKRKRDEIIERKHHLQEAQIEAHQWTIESICDHLQHSDKLRNLLDNEKLKDDEMRELTSKVLNSQTELSLLHKDISNTESQISKLQESKKSAVTARQYREASKLANEEKECLTKLESFKQQLSTADSELSTQTALLSELNGELQTIRQERQLQEKEEDIQNIMKLVSSMTYHKSQLSKISSTTIQLYMILEQWTNIHMLLIQDICNKHELDVHEYLRDCETKSSDNITCNEEENISLMTTEDIGITLKDDPSFETTLEESKDSLETTLEESKDSLEAKISDLELRISKACEEEEFEIAAELDEQLSVLKSELSSRQLN